MKIKPVFFTLFILCCLPATAFAEAKASPDTYELGEIVITGEMTNIESIAISTPLHRRT